MRDIGKNIREMRIKLNMTQEALAEKLFVTRQTVSNYETGKSRPDIEILIKISEILECDINTLLYGCRDNINTKNELRKIILGLVSCSILAIPFMFFWDSASQMIKHGEPELKFILEYFILPMFLLILAWTVMNILSHITKAKAIHFRHGKYIFWAVFLAILIYFVLMLPTILHSIKSLCVNTYIDGLTSPLSFSAGFKLNPQWINKLSGDIWLFIYNKMYLFFIAGIMLWLFAPSSKVSIIHVAVAIILSIIIGVSLYFCGEQKFTLGVQNPEEFEKVPYGIEIVHIQN